MTDKDCPVCCLPFTGVKRVRVTCAYCQYAACQDCYRTYVTSSMHDAHCMSCRQTWSRDVLNSTFPSSWLNTVYKRHRETVLIERERQLLPESQHMVANYRLHKRHKMAHEAKTRELADLKKRMNTLRREIWDHQYAAERHQYNNFQGRTEGEASTSRKRKAEFICPCPAPECRGYMGPDMECKVCDGKACVDCGELLVENNEHTCNDDVMASFKEIKKHTKPCPKCAVPTFKISGCSQMWCTECHTTWDWTSGAIVQGVIHNPHYFAYLRERSKDGEIPRQPGDDPGDVLGNRQCDRQQFPSAYDVTRMIAQIRRQRKEDAAVVGRVLESPERATASYNELVFEDQSYRMTTLLRKLLHIHHHELPHLRRDRHADTADLRLKYLVNEISETEFKIQLQRREKKREKDVAVRDIYQMICDTSRDVLWEFMANRDIEAAMKELEQIRKYANTHLGKIGECYKMKVEFL